MRTETASRLIIGAALGMMLTGCFKIDMDLTVNSDDTVDGTLIVALERDAAGLLGVSEDQISEELERSLTEDMPAGGRAEPYADDMFVGTKVTLDDVPLDELNEGSTTGEVTLTREGDTYVVSGQLNLTEEGLGTGGLEGFDQLAGTAETQLRITFPGDVTETNGELSNEDRTVTWHPQVGEVNEISAVAEADSSGGVPGWLWPLVGIAAIVLAGFVFLNLRKREPIADTTDVGTDETAAAGWTTPPAATDDVAIETDSAPEELTTPETEHWPEPRDRPGS